MSNYPQMLYRPIEGDVSEDAIMLGETPCETLIVADEEEAEIADSDGWLSADAVLKPAPKSKGRKKAAD